jgi:hypothetical protein
MGCCASTDAFPGPAPDDPADYAADSDYMVAYEELLAAFPYAAGDQRPQRQTTTLRDAPTQLADAADATGLGIADDPSAKNPPPPPPLQSEQHCKEPSRRERAAMEKRAMKLLRERNKPLEDRFGDDELCGVLNMRDPCDNPGASFRAHHRARVWQWLREIDLTEVAILCGVLVRTNRRTSGPNDSDPVGNGAGAVASGGSAAGEGGATTMTESSAEKDSREIAALLRAEMRRRAIHGHGTNGGSADASSRASTARYSSASTPGLLYQQGLERMLAAAATTGTAATLTISIDDRANGSPIAVAAAASASVMTQ